MKPVVVRNIERADPAAMAEYGVSTVHEAYGRLGLMKPYLRPVWAGAAIAGPAVTVLAHRPLARARAGQCQMNRRPAFAFGTDVH